MAKLLLKNLLCGDRFIFVPKDPSSENAQLMTVCSGTGTGYLIVGPDGFPREFHPQSEVIRVSIDRERLS